METTTYDPDTLIERADEEQATLTQDCRRAFEWFNDREGGLAPRHEAIAGIAEHLDVAESWAGKVLAGLVGDLVDPVQQVHTKDGRFVGIIEFRTFEDEGAYGYVNYDDVHGRRRRVVCGRCVEKHDHDGQIAHATEGEGTVPDGAEWQELLNFVTGHYSEEHTSAPDEVPIGASLVSGTTIASNTAWHAGNDGQGSGLNADEVRGRNLASEVDDHTGATQGVHGVGSSAVASQNDIGDEINAHTNQDVHAEPQPPASHGNEDHDNDYGIPGVTAVEEFTTNGGSGEMYVVDGNGNVVTTSRQISVYTVADEDERLALDLDPDDDIGDRAVQQDTSTVYIFDGGDSSLNENWTEFDTPMSDIQSSSDVNHDDTTGGTSGNPHADSAHVSDLYTDDEARSAVENGPLGRIDGDGGLRIDFDSESNRIEFEQDGSRTEGLFSRVYLQDGTGWFDGSHGDLSGVGASDHHTRYADSEAVSAVEGQGSLDVGSLTIDQYLDIYTDGGSPGVIQRNADNPIHLENSEGTIALTSQGTAEVNGNQLATQSWTQGYAESTSTADGYELTIDGDTYTFTEE